MIVGFDSKMVHEQTGQEIDVQNFLGVVRFSFIKTV